MKSGIVGLLGNYLQGSPVTLVDIGASGGVHRRWDPMGKHLRVVAFEPDPRADSGQATGSTTYIDAALYGASQEIPFHLTRRQENSSLLKPNRDWLASFPDAARFDVMNSDIVKTQILDGCLEEHGISGVDFIKLDTQGSELDILRGAEKTLSSILFGIEVEVEFVELYAGQPRFADVDGYLRDRGFDLFDLSPYYWKRDLAKDVGSPKGQIIFADALYLKSSEALFAQGSTDSVGVVKALAISSVYGYYDYSLALCAEATSRGILDAQTSDTLTRALRRPRHLAGLLPRLKGRNKIAQAFYLLSETFRIPGWAYAGKGLGNERTLTCRR